VIPADGASSDRSQVEGRSSPSVPPIDLREEKDCRIHPGREKVSTPGEKCGASYLGLKGKFPSAGRGGGASSEGRPQKSIGVEERLGLSGVRRREHLASIPRKGHNPSRTTEKYTC